MLEETVFRLNDTISAFIKIGEVQVGSFGGEITHNLLRSLGQTDSTLRNLATADFARTRALTTRFDRTEPAFWRKCSF